LTSYNFEIILLVFAICALNVANYGRD
jgi:hypothetical protein